MASAWRRAAALLLLLLACGPGWAAEEPARDPDIGTEYDGVAPRPAATVAALRVPASLTVHPDRQQAEGGLRLLGINQTWVGADRIYRPDVLGPALGGLRLPLNRMGGIDSQCVRWRDLIAPSEARPEVADPFDPKRTIQTRIGLMEWLRACLAIDPGAGFSWTFNFMQEEAEDHAALAEFLTGDAATSPLAARRAALGLAAPVEVAVWELGNELDWKKSSRVRFPTVDAYIEACARTIAAVRAAHPGARFAALAATGPWDYQRRGLGDWRAWHRAVLARLGDRLDYLVFHPYYEGLPIREVERYLDVLRDDCAAVPGRSVRLYLSEHGVWPPELKDRATWVRTHDLGGSLAVGAFIARMAMRPEIGAMAMHALSDGPWGMVYPRADGSLWPTGLVGLFHLLQDWGDGPVLAATLEDPAATGDALPLVAAVRGGPDGLRVLALNRLEEPRQLAWRTPGTWRCRSIVRLAGPGPGTANSAAAQPLGLRREPGSSEAVTGFVLPPWSASLLHLVRDP